MHRGSKPAGAMSGLSVDTLLAMRLDCRKQPRRVKLIVDQYCLCLSDFDYQCLRGPTKITDCFAWGSALTMMVEVLPCRDVCASGQLQDRATRSAFTDSLDGRSIVIEFADDPPEDVNGLFAVVVSKLDRNANAVNLASD